MTHTEAAALTLSTRIEQSPSGSRELDAQIWCAINGKKYKGQFETHLGWRAEYTETPKRTTCVSPMLPAYTTSLDAALMLVPPDWNWLVRADVDEAQSFANVSAPDADNVWYTDMPAHKQSTQGHNYAYAASPALALAAAAMRVRGL